MRTSRIALVSGANRGLGLETSRQLALRGVTGLMGARDVDRGRQAANDLKIQGLPVEAIQIDVTSNDHIVCGQAGH